MAAVQIRGVRGFDSTAVTFYPACMTVSKLTLGLLLVPSALSAAPPDPVAVVRDRVSEAARVMRLGDAKLRLGDLRGACQDYEKTIEVLPYWWMPHLARARCGRFTGVPLKTLIKHAEFAVRARPEIPLTHLQYGLILEEVGDVDAAIAAYQAALRRLTKLPEARYRLGVLLARRKRYKAATRHLEQALQMRPQLVQARWKLVRLYEQLGRLTEAEAEYKELSTRSHNPRFALAQLVRFYDRHEMKERREQARKRFLTRFGR